MSLRKTAIAAAAAALLLAGCAMLPEKTVTVGDTEYPISTQQLDLSGTALSDTQELFLLKDLQELNLLDTGIPAYAFDALQEALPECSIRWSVPIGGTNADSESESLQLSSLSQEDLQQLTYFPKLREVDLTACPDPEPVKLLLEARPDLKVDYRVRFGNREIDPDTSTLILKDADPAELAEKLPLLPDVRKVILTGNLPEPARIRDLQEAFPDITFAGNPTIGGVITSLTAVSLDLTKAQFADTEELETWLPCFKNLTRIDLGDSNLANEDLDRLNKQFPDTKIVWKVSIGPLRISTDVTWFMPNALGYVNLPTSAFRNLRYCTDITMIDLGHFEVTDVSFVEFMPNLEYLLLCDARIKDVTPIGNCTNLRFLELFLSSVNDFSPLLNLTKLEDLNLAFDPCLAKNVWGAAADLTPLYRMPWLHRLWMPMNGLNHKQQQEFREALPATMILFPTAHDSSTGKGWRMCANYYKQRDIVGRYYMTK